MASVTVTAADVRPLPGAIVRRYEAGATMTPGDLVYVASDGQVELADIDGAASAQAIGIVVAGPDGKTSFSTGEQVDVVVFGPVAGFSSLTPGALHYGSVTAGDIETAAPSGSSGDYLWIVGYAEAAAVLFVRCWTPDTAAQ